MGRKRNDTRNPWTDKTKEKYYNYRVAAKRRGEPLDDFDTWYDRRVAQGKDPQIQNTRISGELSYARLRYNRQRAQAKFRDIEWQFDFDTWMAWWAAHGIDRNIPTPERGSDRLCMCRYEDRGAYHPDNVYLATNGENVQHSHQNIDRSNFGVGRHPRSKD